MKRTEAIAKAREYLAEDATPLGELEEPPTYVGEKDGCWLVLFKTVGVMFGHDGQVHSEVGPKEFKQVKAECDSQQ